MATGNQVSFIAADTPGLFQPPGRSLEDLGSAPQAGSCLCSAGCLPLGFVENQIFNQDRAGCTGKGTLGGRTEKSRGRSFFNSSPYLATERATPEPHARTLPSASFCLSSRPAGAPSVATDFCEPPRTGLTTTRGPHFIDDQPESILWPATARTTAPVEAFSVAHESAHADGRRPGRAASCKKTRCYSHSATRTSFRRSSRCFPHVNTMNAVPLGSLSVFPFRETSPPPVTPIPSAVSVLRATPESRAHCPARSQRKRVNEKNCWKAGTEPAAVPAAPEPPVSWKETRPLSPVAARSVAAPTEPATLSQSSSFHQQLKLLCRKVRGRLGGALHGRVTGSPPGREKKSARRSLEGATRNKATKDKRFGGFGRSATFRLDFPLRKRRTPQETGAYGTCRLASTQSTPESFEAATSPGSSDSTCGLAGMFNAVCYNGQKRWSCYTGCATLPPSSDAGDKRSDQTESICSPRGAYTDQGNRGTITGPSRVSVLQSSSPRLGTYSLASSSVVEMEEQSRETSTSGGGRAAAIAQPRSIRGRGEPGKRTSCGLCCVPHENRQVNNLAEHSGWLTPLSDGQLKDGRLNQTTLAAVVQSDSDNPWTAATKEGGRCFLGFSDSPTGSGCQGVPKPPHLDAYRKGEKNAGDYSSHDFGRLDKAGNSLLPGEESGVLPLSRVDTATTTVPSTPLQWQSTISSLPTLRSPISFTGNSGAGAYEADSHADEAANSTRSAAGPGVSCTRLQASQFTSVRCSLSATSLGASLPTSPKNWEGERSDTSSSPSFVQTHRDDVSDNGSGVPLRKARNGEGGNNEKTGTLSNTVDQEWWREAEKCLEAEPRCQDLCCVRLAQGFPQNGTTLLPCAGGPPRYSLSKSGSEHVQGDFATRQHQREWALEEVRQYLSSRKLSIEDFEMKNTVGTGTLGRVYLACLKEPLNERDRPYRRHLLSHWPRHGTPLPCCSISSSRSGSCGADCTEDLDQSLKAGASSAEASVGHRTDVENICNLPLALKVMKKRQVLALGQEKHVTAERTILRQLSHPFIVNMISSFQDRRRIYILMEFINGGELFSLLRSEGTFAEHTARFYVAEILLALEYLHARAIVYRDLKPENILLDQYGHVKLVDFGFARFLSVQPSPVDDKACFSPKKSPTGKYQPKCPPVSPVATYCVQSSLLDGSSENGSSATAKEKKGAPFSDRIASCHQRPGLYPAEVLRTAALSVAGTSTSDTQVELGHLRSHTGHWYPLFEKPDLPRYSSLRSSVELQLSVGGITASETTFSSILKGDSLVSLIASPAGQEICDYPTRDSLDLKRSSCEPPLSPWNVGLSEETFSSESGVQSSSSLLLRRRSLDCLHRSHSSEVVTLAGHGCEHTSHKDLAVQNGKLASTCLQLGSSLSKCPSAELQRAQEGTGHRRGKQSPEKFKHRSNCGDGEDSKASDEQLGKDIEQSPTLFFPCREIESSPGSPLSSSPLQVVDCAKCSVSDGEDIGSGLSRASESGDPGGPATRATSWSSIQLDPPSEPSEIRACGSSPALTDVTSADQREEVVTSISRLEADGCNASGARKFQSSEESQTEKPAEASSRATWGVFMTPVEKAGVDEPQARCRQWPPSGQTGVYDSPAQSPATDERQSGTWDSHFHQSIFSPPIQYPAIGIKDTEAAGLDYSSLANTVKPVGLGGEASDKEKPPCLRSSPLGSMDSVPTLQGSCAQVPGHYVGQPDGAWATALDRPRSAPRGGTSSSCVASYYVGAGDCSEAGGLARPMSCFSPLQFGTPPPSCCGQPECHGSLLLSSCAGSTLSSTTAHVSSCGMELPSIPFSQDASPDEGLSREALTWAPTTGYGAPPAEFLEKRAFLSQSGIPHLRCLGPRTDMRPVTLRSPTSTLSCSPTGRLPAARLRPRKEDTTFSSSALADENPSTAYSDANIPVDPFSPLHSLASVPVLPTPSPAEQTPNNRRKPDSPSLLSFSSRPARDISWHHTACTQLSMNSADLYSQPATCKATASPNFSSECHISGTLNANVHGDALLAGRPAADKPPRKASPSRTTSPPWISEASRSPTLGRHPAQTPCALEMVAGMRRSLGCGSHTGYSPEFQKSLSRGEREVRRSSSRSSFEKRQERRVTAVRGSLFCQPERRCTTSCRGVPVCERELAGSEKRLDGVRTVYPSNSLVEDEGTTRLRAFTLCGTPEYLPPEVLLVKGHDCKADCWAMGILLYEMLVGQTPFYNENPQEMYENILHSPVPFIPRLSPAAMDLIERLLRKSGRKRPSLPTVKLHPYFTSVQFDWKAAEHGLLVPPFVPPVRTRADTHMFDDYPDSVESDGPSPTSEEDSWFEDF
ncbi:protein kinase (incomplete catalytic triad) [Cystoisospora suis]|uniref:non-specific serine/threonine protein kinase n=1 Tax=Cystoisospora suis TaxID=483139 RepID=A0A2C6KYF4_9APIC|nr:protein kinase (incomplete catalytic triad) [Cystoisospora suis]